MIKINISVLIEADSIEEAKKDFAQLRETPFESLAVATPVTGETSSPAPVEKPKTRATRAATVETKKEEAVVVPMNTADPLGAAPTAGDPLAGLPTTTSADPLGTSAPVADPLASAPAETKAPVATPATISLQTIREKIGTLTDKKQQCKDLIATYKKADGTPCEKPSDLQESDYAAVYEDLDYI